MAFLRFLPVFLAFVLFSNCSRQDITIQVEDAGTEIAVITEQYLQVYSPLPWPALALIQSGENPLWFELGPEGPSIIEYPAAASLAPFTPWPHARHISRFLVWEGFLVMAVNRDGFLILGPDDSEETSGTANVILYRVADSGFWDPYTAESLFIWEDRPAVLLYRNDFFTLELPPRLENQVFVLEKFIPVPLAARVPALESFPSSGVWEAELLQRGPDGQWYYRMREKEVEEAETRFFLTDDLSRPGNRISDDEWRASFFPEENDNFAGHDLWPSLLPPLPEDFYYTGFFLLGNVLIALWEEQDLPAIGAAGFMVIRFDAN